MCAHSGSCRAATRRSQMHLAGDTRRSTPKAHLQVSNLFEQYKESVRSVADVASQQRGGEQ